MYSYDEVMTFVEEEDVKFIRLAFCDVHGRQKNISIMPSELKRAFTEGISFDASAVPGFGNVVKSDLFLHPDPSTLSVLPWPTVWATTAVTASTPPRSRKIWVGTPRPRLRRASC